MRNWVLIVAMICSGGRLTLAEDRVPEPNTAQQAEAEKLVREAYKEDFIKRGIEERRALGRKMLDEARNSKSDMASAYVLFRESREAAVQVGDVETAIAAIDEMAAEFTIDAAELKLAALTQMKTTARSNDGQQLAAVAALKLVDDAMELDKIDVASKAADLAYTFATIAKNMPLASAANLRRSEVKGQELAYMAMKIAAARLSKDPKDAGSNYAMGLYLCAYKNDWDKGLALLKLGSEPAFAAAAKADLASPVDLPEMLKVADGWWDLASAHPAQKPRLMVRAEFWYKLVSNGADGLIKEKADKRLEQIAAARQDAGTLAVSSVANSTQKAIPAAAEMQHVKELIAQLQIDPMRQGEYVQYMNMLQTRLQQYFNANFPNIFNPGFAPATRLKEADFFVCCKADLEIRQAAAVVPQYAIDNLNLIGSFQLYAEQAASKEEFIARMLAYEKFNETEHALDPFNLDSVVYLTLRTYVKRNAAFFPTQQSRIEFCGQLKAKGMKSGGVDRYQSYALRFRFP